MSIAASRGAGLCTYLSSTGRARNPLLLPCPAFSMVAFSHHALPLVGICLPGNPSLHHLAYLGHALLSSKGGSMLQYSCASTSCGTLSRLLSVRVSRVAMHLVTNDTDITLSSQSPCSRSIALFEENHHPLLIPRDLGVGFFIPTHIFYLERCRNAELYVQQRMFAPEHLN